MDVLRIAGTVFLIAAVVALNVSLIVGALHLIGGAAPRGGRTCGTRSRRPDVPRPFDPELEV